MGGICPNYSNNISIIWDHPTDCDKLNYNDNPEVELRIDAQYGSNLEILLKHWSDFDENWVLNNSINWTVSDSKKDIYKSIDTWDTCHVLKNWTFVVVMWSSEVSYQNAFGVINQQSESGAVQKCIERVLKHKRLNGICNNWNILVFQNKNCNTKDDWTSTLKHNEVSQYQISQVAENIYM